jgi:hypothetical protein
VTDPEPGAESAAAYLLPEAENRRVFHQEIVPDQMWAAPLG